MVTPAEVRSGKGHRDENFPVASRLIHPRHRAPILAFYEFVRTADDIADHATLAAAEKLALLDRLEDMPLVVFDAGWDLVAWNPLGIALLGDLEVLSGRERNLAWREFLGTPTTRFLRDDEETERGNRSIASLFPADPAFAGMSYSQRYQEMLKRFERIEVVGEPKRVYSSFVRGIESLPVRIPA